METLTVKMPAFEGRKVSSAWHRLEPSEVIRWEPLSAALCDVLVREPSGRECWYASSDLQPADGLGPLPSRAHAREVARAQALESLRAIRAGLVAEIREGKPWPGQEFGKALVGQSIDAAIRDLYPDASEVNS